MRELTTGDDFETIKIWLHTNLKENKSFVPCKEELLNLKSKEDSKSKGIYFWFMQTDGYEGLNNFVTIQAIEPKFTRIIDNLEYDLVYLGTTGTGKQGKNNFYGRLDWHVTQVHRESTIKQKESALSTLRTGLGSLLADDLIIPNTETIINDFMKTYMKVFWIEYPDNKTLINGNEEILISEIKPLLNLKQNSNSWKIALDNPTKLYKSRRNLIENNTKKRLGFYSKLDNLIIKSEIEGSKSNNKSSFINEHKFELNNEEYILTYHDKPRLTKNGNEQKVKPLLIEYITKNDLPVQLVNSKGNDEVTYTIVRKVLEHFSDNTIKIQTASNSIKLDITTPIKISPKNTNQKDSTQNSCIDGKIDEKLILLDWEELKNNKTPKLLIIGCCDAKSYQPNNLPNGKYVNCNFGDSLIKLRKSRLEFYKELPDSYFNKKKRNGELANKTYFMDSLNENNRREALDVYGSNRSPFYNPDMKKLFKDKIKNSNLHLLIISGLYGIIKHDDYINDYHLEIGRGNKKWAGSQIQEVVKNYISDNKIPNTNVFYSLSDNYLPFLKPIPQWENLWLSHDGHGDNQANDLMMFLGLL